MKENLSNWQFTYLCVYPDNVADASNICASCYKIPPYLISLMPKFPKPTQTKIKAGVANFFDIFFEKVVGEIM